MCTRLVSYHTIQYVKLLSEENEIANKQISKMRAELQTLTNSLKDKVCSTRDDDC